MVAGLEMTRQSFSKVRKKVAGCCLITKMDIPLVRDTSGAKDTDDDVQEICQKAEGL